MAGAGIIKVKYDSEFENIIQALSKASAPRLLDLANTAGGKLDRISKKAFELEKDPVTKRKWDELARPRHDGKTHPILWDGGQLHRSLIWEAYPDGSVIYGSNVVYARIHQEGGAAGRKQRTTIRARPYMGIPRDFDRRLLADSAVQELLGLKQ